jgi:predicted O-linked N-acetylglucosamine transferase (SPINDLY family)
VPATPPTIQELFSAARQQHRAGRLSEAAPLYRRILAIDPRHADSLHLLGVTLVQTGRPDAAADLINQAIAINPNVAAFHANLGNVLQQQGQPEAAIACFRRALELRPDLPDAHNNLGNALNERGQPEEAIRCFHRALELRPNYPEAHNNLGCVLRQAGRLGEAAASFRRALDLRADYPEAQNNLGDVLRRQGRPAEAAAWFRRAISLRPNDPEAHNHLGTVLREPEQLAEAIACFERALTLRPDHAEARYNLGNALQQQGRLEEAAACYRTAVTLRPDFPEAHNNLGNVLQQQGRLEQSVACRREALRLRPNYPEASYNLGTALLKLWRLDAAADCFRHAIALRPDFPEAHNNLGNVLKEQGRLGAAVAQYRRALEIRPDSFLAYSSLLFAQNYLADEAPETLRELARGFGVLATSRVERGFTEWRDAAPGQPLRVGLVSGDLGNHPVGYFLEGLLREADPARIAFVAFPTQPDADELTARIKPLCAAWQPIHDLGDAAAAERIHASGVQVLLDLSGHTSHNRLPVFAWRPAPVQAAWLGYFATTGIAEIDYVIGDPQVAPAEEAGHFTETPWRLPDIYLCFTPPAIEVAVSRLPAQMSGCVTFGCFNNLAKLNDAVVAVWARVLLAVPGGRLLLKAFQLSDPAVGDGIRARFAAHGIGADLLLLEPPSSRADYLRAYHRVDIALDPFPYPGGTTSAEALWMGVPVLTKRGNRFLSHAGETIMRNAGLANWIAADDDAYVALAVDFAADIGRLAALRAGLRDQVLASPLFDAPRFARHFETAMWGMWKRGRGGWRGGAEARLD